MTAKTSGASPDKRRKYDEAFKAEALRLAGESHSTQAAARHTAYALPGPRGVHILAIVRQGIPAQLATD